MPVCKKALQTLVMLILLACAADQATCSQVSQGTDREDDKEVTEDRAVAELVGIEGGVVSGVINLESSGVEASDWRPRHDEQYHDA